MNTVSKQFNIRIADQLLWQVITDEFHILIASEIIGVGVISVVFHNPTISLKQLSLITLTEFFRISEYLVHETHV